MSTVRRVVTRTNGDGQSAVHSDGAPAVAMGETGSGPRLTVIWEATTGDIEVKPELCVRFV